MEKNTFNTYHQEGMVLNTFNTGLPKLRYSVNSVWSTTGLGLSDVIFFHTSLTIFFNYLFKSIVLHTYIRGDAKKTGLTFIHIG